MAVDYLSAINKQGSGLNVTQIVDSLVKRKRHQLKVVFRQKLMKRTQRYLHMGFSLENWETERLCVFFKGTTAFTVSSNNTAVGVSVTDPPRLKRSMQIFQSLH